MKETKKKKYDYSQISIPAEVKDEAEKVMPLIGCRTMTSFVSMALKEYINKVQTQNKN